MKEQTLGTTISTLRKAHGMTQLELAEQMGVTDKAVSKWERDLSCPDVASIPRLAEIFGVTVDELMQGGTGRDAAPKPAETGRDIGSLVNTILRAVGMAMGVAVAVLSLMGQMEPQTGMGLLGLGLASLAASTFPPNPKP